MKFKVLGDGGRGGLTELEEKEVTAISAFDD